MGVSGSGKSTIGTRLARRLNCAFHDGDDYHPPSNVERMRAGIPLTDEDRWPWLAALARLIQDSLAEGQSVVIACSALKAAYRGALHVDDRVRFVYLRGSMRLIAQRQGARRDHFMPASLLESQFAILEEPADAIVVNVAHSPKAIVEEIVAQLMK